MGPPDPVGPTFVASLTRVPIRSSGWDGDGAGWGVASSVEAASSDSVAISAISAPMGMVCPGSTKMSVNTPSTGDGISMLTLSVTTSASGSYFSTRSPTCLSHRSMTASVTDSPTCGSVILIRNLVVVLYSLCQFPPGEGLWILMPIRCDVAVFSLTELPAMTMCAERRRATTRVAPTGRLEMVCFRRNGGMWTRCHVGNREFQESWHCTLTSRPPGCAWPRRCARCRGGIRPPASG